MWVQASAREDEGTLKGRIYTPGPEELDWRDRPVLFGEDADPCDGTVWSLYRDRAALAKVAAQNLQRMRDADNEALGAIKAELTQMLDQGRETPFQGNYPDYSYRVHGGVLWRI